MIRHVLTCCSNSGLRCVCVVCVALYSGGTTLTVTGERLNLVQSPSLAIYVKDDMFTGVRFDYLLKEKLQKPFLNTLYSRNV